MTKKKRKIQKYVKEYPKNPVKALRYSSELIKGKGYLQILTQQKLADRVGCEQAYICKLEKEQMSPSAVFLGMLLINTKITKGYICKIARYYYGLSIGVQL